MSARSIEARLVISGEDHGASAAIANVVKTIRQMEDAAKVSKPLQEVAKSLQQVETASRAVDGAMKARAGFSQAEASLKAARDAAAATAKAFDDARRARAAFDGVKASKGSEQAAQIDALTKAVREAGSAHRKAEGDVRKATAAVAAQASTMERADASARRVGADLANLEAHQRQLRTTYNSTTAAIVRQVEAEQRAGRIGATMGTSGRAQLERIEAGRRLADGMSAQARATKSLADEEARLVKIEHERKRLHASGDLASGMGVSGRAQADRIASSRRLVDGMGQSSRDAATFQAQAKEELSALRTVRLEAAKALASGAGIYIGHKASEAGRAVGHTYAEFDDLIRYQTKVADLTPAERKSRMAQAVHLGGETSFNDIQVLETQLTLAQRGVKKEFVEPFTREIVNYAQAMNTTLPDAAKTLEGVIFSTNQNVEDANSAMGVMRKNVDMLVKTAKVGGLQNEDLKEAFKFGGASGTGAGLSAKTMGTIFATLHRVGYAGSEAGVATRAIAARLVSPTNKGRDALDAMGIDYNKFTTMPDAMSGKGLGTMVRRSLGKDMSPEQMAKIQAEIDNQTFTDEDGKERSIVEDQGRFAAALSPILLENFAKNKKGEHTVKDQKDVAKILGRFYSMSIQSVNSEGLLAEILAKDPTMAQANALFSEKHGGKVVAMARKLDVFKEIMEAIEHVPDGFAKGIGDYRMGGFSGSMKRLKNTRLNMETAAGRALDNDGDDNGGILTKVISSIADFQQHIAELDPKIVALASGVAYAGAKLAEVAGVAGLAGSAVALYKSAAALDAAALKLAGGKPAELIKEGAKTGAAAGAGAGATFGIGGITVLGGAAAGAYLDSNFGGNPGALGLVTGQESDQQKSARYLAEQEAERKRGALFGERANLLDNLKREREARDAYAKPDDAGFLTKGLDALGYGSAEERQKRRDGLKAESEKNIAEMEAQLAAIDAKIKTAAAAPLPPVRPPDLSQVEEKATETGQKAGQAIADGIKDKAPEVEQQGVTIFQRLRETFSQGIFVPINFVPNGAGGGGSSGGGLIQKASFDAEGGLPFGGGGAGIGGVRSGGGAGVGSGGGVGVPGAFGSRAISAKDMRDVNPEMADYIRRSALANGIDPNVALRIANSEGLRGSIPGVRNTPGDKGTSFGPFQLHYASRIPGLTLGGLGDRYTKATGHHASDPKHWREQIDFALGVARKEGWGAWHGRIGAGIGLRDGIGTVRPVPMARAPEPRLVKGEDGKEGLDLGNGTMKMPDGSIRPIPTSIPSPPEGGFGGRGGIDRHVEAFGQHVDRLAGMGFDGRISVAVSGGGGAQGRVTGLKVRGRGGMRADMGVSMPGAKEDLDDWN